MARTQRPQVTTDTIGQYELRFETTTCSRCGGTGKHSFNQLDGDRCYGCPRDKKDRTSGTGIVLTRAGATASKRYHEKINELMSTPVEDILPGDKIYASFFYVGDAGFGKVASFSEKWVTVLVASHDIKSSALSAAVDNPRDPSEHPEDWKQYPAQVNLYGYAATERHAREFKVGEPRGHYVARRGSTVPRYDREAQVQAWNATLKLKGSYLVDKTTGEEIGRPTAEDIAAAQRAADNRRRNAEQKRAKQEAQQAQEAAARLAEFIAGNDTARRVHEFDSDAHSYAARTLRDLKESLKKYGRLTERQLDFAARLLDEHAQTTK